MAFRKILILLVLGLFISNGVFAIQPIQENQKIQEEPFFYYFYGINCPFCKIVEENFFPGLKERNPDLKIKKIEVWHSPPNARFFGEMAINNFGLDLAKLGVPAMFIGEYYIIGLPNPREEKMIERTVQYCLAYGCPSPQNVTPEQAINLREKIRYITLPIIGEINIADYSFPIITIMIAAADGFNPCALWVLMFLLLLVLKEPSRKRLSLIVGTFILVSGIFYFFLLAAWLHLFLIIGHIRTVQMIIGLVALGVGFWQLKSFFSTKTAVCPISQKENKVRKITEKIKKIIAEKSSLLTIVGVATLAIMVNFFEFVCSAGFPAIWSSLLALQGFPMIYNYVFILLYVLVFMLDEFIIFAIAFATLKITKISDKITKWASLIGGLLMIILGLLILLKPELLIFI